MPITVFISYSHKDKRLREKLDNHLSMLRHRGLIADWYDGQISVGQEWEQEIITHLNSARIILLLISADFLASKFCYGIEMQHAITRHEKGEAIVIPILLRPVDWGNAPFSKLQALPTNAKPVTKWSPQDEAFADIAKGIRRALELLAEQVGSTSNNWSPSNQSTEGYWKKLKIVEFQLVSGDITSFETDVVALKYAQSFYGADKTIANLLQRVGISKEMLRPPVGDYQYIATRNIIKAKHVLYISTPDLLNFDYQSIKYLSEQTLSILANEAPFTRHIAMTIHGVNFGLDEAEAVYAQVIGFIEALQNGQFPSALESITIVEFEDQRVQRLRQVLEKALDKITIAEKIRDSWAYRFSIQQSSISTAKSIIKNEPLSMNKPHIFVAMPFLKEMDDIFYYGIQKPIHEAGFLCERIDGSSFTGDILDRVKQKIETAVAVIANLTGANPNVYLEVGYAWGKKRPTILLIKNEQELCFDVQGQKCLKYETIKALEDTLSKELKNLQDEGIIKRDPIKNELLKQ